MSDAWIVGGTELTAAVVAREIAELGLRPLRMPAPGSARPESADGDASRVPAVALVLDDPAIVPALAGVPGMEGVPTLLVIAPERLGDEVAAVAVDELLVRPYCPAELATRIRRARGAVNGIAADDIVRIAGLQIDLATYQVTVDGQPIDFTFMEYELLRFLATHPNRAFTREALLSRVWGYDYYGGARTVDVHVRRVRAKLGEEHAERIVTVRSVGYRFEVKDPAAARGPRTGVLVDLRTRGAAPREGGESHVA